MDAQIAIRSTAIPDGEDKLAPLIAATADGDRAAFAELYRASAGKLFSVCLAILGDRGAAEEALQEAYVNVWRNARAFDRNKGSGTVWLTSIARYRALSLRRRAGRETPADIEAEFASLADPNPGPLAAAIHGAERRALMRCLDELEAQPREAVVLAFFKGMTHEELAGQLQAPLGTVKSWIRRSLSRLKECLDHGPA